MGTKTGWHYDSHENIMIVLEGKKTFFFLPNNTSILEKGKSIGKNYN